MLSKQNIKTQPNLHSTFFIVISYKGFPQYSSGDYIVFKSTTILKLKCALVIYKMLCENIGFSLHLPGYQLQKFNVLFKTTLLE